MNELKADDRNMVGAEALSFYLFFLFEQGVEALVKISANKFLFT